MDILSRQLTYKLWIKPEEAADRLQKLILTTPTAFEENIRNVAHHLRKDNKPEIESKWYFSTFAPEGKSPEHIRWYHGEIREKTFWMHRLYSFSYFFNPKKVRVQRQLKGRMQSFKGKILPATHGSLVVVKVRPPKWARAYLNVLTGLLLFGTFAVLYKAFTESFGLETYISLSIFLVVFLANYIFIRWQVNMETDSLNKDMRELFSDAIVKNPTK